MTPLGMCNSMHLTAAYRRPLTSTPSGRIWNHLHPLLARSPVVFTMTFPSRLVVTVDDGHITFICELTPSIPLAILRLRCLLTIGHSHRAMPEFISPFVVRLHHLTGSARNSVNGSNILKKNPSYGTLVIPNDSSLIIILVIFHATALLLLFLRHGECPAGGVVDG